MMLDTSLSIRTDKETKDRASELFNELGLNMTSAINIFLKTAIRERGLPFDVKLSFDEATLEAMEESEKISKDTTRIRYKNIKEFFENYNEGYKCSEIDWGKKEGNEIW